MKRDISIIIPTCGYDDLKLCVASIIKTTDFGEVNAEFIIVANGLPIEAKEWLEGLGPHFPFLWFDERVGVCKTTNLAVAQLATSDLIGKMDDDVEILLWGGGSQWLRNIIKPLQNAKIGLVSPALYKYEGEFMNNYYGMIGFLMVTRRTLWDQLGGLDEVFDPGMGEDTDFAFKVQLAGFEVSPPYYDDVMHRTEDGERTGNYPIWHKSRGNYGGEEKMREIRRRNTDLLNKKYEKTTPYHN